MYLYGSIFDSSEIINSDLCYYCRPQGKLVLLSDDKLLRNLNSTYIRLNTTNPQYPLPVFNSVDNSYKFYTITSSEVQKLVETNTGMIIKAKLKVRQLVGFKPNSVWKEIINNDTNIRTGLMFYLANNVTSGDNGSTSFYNSELSRFKYYMLSREKANQWAAVNGYGTAIYNLNIELSSQTNDTFSISPCIIDEKNKIVYQTSNEITQSGFINEGV